MKGLLRTAAPHKQVAEGQSRWVAVEAIIFVFSSIHNMGWQFLFLYFFCIIISFAWFSHEILLNIYTGFTIYDDLQIVFLVVY